MLLTNRKGQSHWFESNQRTFGLHAARNNEHFRNTVFWDVYVLKLFVDNRVFAILSSSSHLDVWHSNYNYLYKVDLHLIILYKRHTLW